MKDINGSAKIFFPGNGNPNADRESRAKKSRVHFQIREYSDAHNIMRVKQRMQTNDDDASTNSESHINNRNHGGGTRKHNKKGSVDTGGLLKSQSSFVNVLYIEPIIAPRPTFTFSLGKSTVC